LQRESQNSLVYKQTKSVNNRKTVKTVKIKLFYAYTVKFVLHIHFKLYMCTCLKHKRC